MSKRQKNRKAPRGTAIPTQRKVITQTHVTRVLALMQGWGYDNYDLGNLVAAIKIAQEVKPCAL